MQICRASALSAKCVTGVNTTRIISTAISCSDTRRENKLSIQTKVAHLGNNISHRCIPCIKTKASSTMCRLRIKLYSRRAKVFSTQASKNTSAVRIIAQVSCNTQLFLHHNSRAYCKACYLLRCRIVSIKLFSRLSGNHRA